MITDEDSLRDWIDENSRESVRVLAIRTALRVMPLWGEKMGMRWAQTGGLSALPLLRVGLTVGISKGAPSPEVEEASISSLSALPSRGSLSVEPAEFDVVAAANAALATTRATAASSFDVSLDVFLFGRRAHSRASHGAILTAYFHELDADARLIDADADPTVTELWHGSPPDWFTQAWAETQRIWDADPAPWVFWRRWYQGILDGTPLPDALLHDIALIPDDIWQTGPAAVAKAIAAIEEQHAAGEALTDLDTELARLRLAPRKDVITTRQAILANREALPGTFDAILGFITLEIDRLQTRNFRDEDDAIEAQRQIHVLSTLHSAVERIQGLVPLQGDVSEAVAEQVEGLARLYQRKFQEWPRQNCDEVVDSTFRGALVGATATLLPLLGVNPVAAVTAGIVLFGGKKVVDAVKAAKDAMGM